MTRGNLLAAILLAAPMAAQSATITAFLRAGFETVDEIHGKNLFTGADTAVDPVGDDTVSDAPANGGGAGEAYLSYDDNAGTMAARATAGNEPGIGPSRFDAQVDASYFNMFTAMGDGTVNVTFDLLGRFDVLTDLPDPTRFVNVRGSLAIIGDGLNFFEGLDNHNASDPLFGLTNSSFNRQFSHTFDVQDGDTFEINPELFASAGTLELVPGFFDAFSEISSILRISSDDTTLIDEGDISTTPVPIPAGGLLLLTPLGALIAIRRRHRS